MGYCLIGITSSELDRVARPAFLRTLAGGFDEHGARPVRSPVYRVTDSEEVYALRAQWGERYVHFYYLDDAALEAANDLGLHLNRLHAAETPVRAEAFTTVQLPELYSRKAGFPPPGQARRSDRIKI